MVLLDKEKEWVIRHEVDDRFRRVLPPKKKGSGESIPNPRISSAVAAAATVPFSFTWTEHWWTIEGTASVASISSSSAASSASATISEKAGRSSAVRSRPRSARRRETSNFGIRSSPTGTRRSHGRFVKESGRVGAELAHQARQPVAVVGEVDVHGEALLAPPAGVAHPQDLEAGVAADLHVGVEVVSLHEWHGDLAAGR